MTRRDGEAAVSSVVSAVLLFALFTSVFVLYSVQTLPEWKADREHVHQRAVQGGLGALKAGLEGLSARKDPGPVTAAFQLGTPPVPLLQSTPASGDLELLDPENAAGNGFGSVLTFPAGASVFLTDGAAVSTPTAPIAAATSPCSGLCLRALTALVVGFRTSNVGPQSAALAVTASDGTSTATATLTHSDTNSASTCSNSGNQVTLSTGGSTFVLLCGVSSSLSTPYRVDLLNPSYGFGAAVGRLKPPFSLTLTPSTTPSATSSTYTAVWQDMDGLERVAGTGLANSKPVPDLAGGRLVFTPHYQGFPNQALSLEGGAVVATESPTLQAVAVDPSFTMKVHNGVGYLRWTLVQLAGTGQLSGTQDATVAVTHTASQDLLLTTPASCNPCASLALSTPSTAAWNGFFATRSLAAGAGASAAASGSTLLLASGAGQPVTAGWVLHLRVIQGDARVS